MFQGNPAGRRPAGLSNYWSPEPQAAATYSNPGKGKGIPGRGPNPTGTLTTAQRPPGTPRVTRGLTGTPQFKSRKDAGLALLHHQKCLLKWQMMLLYLLAKKYENEAR